MSKFLQRPPHSVHKRLEETTAGPELQAFPQSHLWRYWSHPLEVKSQRKLNLTAGAETDRTFDGLP